jgi:hypothetical protein
MRLTTLASSAALAGIDLGLVALPKCVMIRPLRTLSSTWFALALLALIAVPVLAAFALGYVMHGARPVFATVVPTALLVGVTAGGAVVGSRSASSRCASSRSRCMGRSR